MTILDLIGRDVPLHRVANTGGGEWAGPCPWCGGEDRFRVWPFEGEHGRYWCRQCERSGDAIQYLRERHGLSFKEACERLGIEKRYLRKCPTSVKQPSKSTPLQGVECPNEAWQREALAFCKECERILWSDKGKKALAWLQGRGFEEETIRSARLGYNPSDRRYRREQWGLEPEQDRNGKPKMVWLPRGIVIPWWVEGKLWKVNIRRPKGDPKYIQAAGSKMALYNADQINAAKPAMLLEGEFDVLTVQQYAGDLITPVATGSAQGGRRIRWVAKLALAPLVLVSFDADGAGEEASRWWLNVLEDAKRWRPFWNDANTMAQEGGNIRLWVELGIGAVGSEVTDEQDKQSEEERCPVCKSRRWWVSIYGQRICAVCHPPASEELVAKWEGGAPEV